MSVLSFSFPPCMPISIGVPKCADAYSHAEKGFLFDFSDILLSSAVIQDQIRAFSVRLCPICYTLIYSARYAKIQSFMSKIFRIKLALILCATVFSLSVTAQPVGSIPYTSQEVSEIDGIPVLIKHLPAWESVREHTVFAKSIPELQTALGARPILDLIDFSAGTEAVTAPYEAGQLLIIEYTTPQASVDADT